MQHYIQYIFIQYLIYNSEIIIISENIPQKSIYSAINKTSCIFHNQCEINQFQHQNMMSTTKVIRETNQISQNRKAHYIHRYFKNTLSNPDMQIYKKQVIKKIIVYTTQGIDTSRFYPQMVLASGTKDLVQKKLIFFYLSIYSHHNNQFARMAINTFTKDSDSPNPNIRALAIRHLSNLRFKGRQQYIMPILKKGLDDFSSIVKKSCLMGITKIIAQQNRKLSQLQPQSQNIRDQQLLNKLYGMLRDNDPYVICTVIQAINQIQPQGIAMSKKLTHYLIKNIQNFHQLQLAVIINYIELYDPKEEQQILQILNKLDYKIKSQNLSLVLAISKVYLKYGEMSQNLSNNKNNNNTHNNINIMSQIHKKIKSSLLSFINCDIPQKQYLALKHILYIIKKYQTNIYNTEIKKFYLKQSDPTYNKLIKIQLLQINCTKQNFGDIINQFTQYIKQYEIIDKIIQSLNSIILRFELQQSKLIIKTLNDIIINTSNRQYICNAAIKTMRIFLRKYPQQFDIFQHTFYIYIRGISQIKSKCSMIQIIGDFGQYIQDAIQLIAYSQSDIQIQDELKIALLRANIKLFFKRPIEMLNIITHLFKQILGNQQTRMYIRDYATMLYRAMQNNIEQFKKVFLTTRPHTDHKPINNKLLYNQLQFNTLQIAYMKPNKQWLIAKDKYIQLLNPIQYKNDEQIHSTGQIQMSQQQLQLTQLQKIQKNRSMVDLSSQYTKIIPQDIVKQYTMTAQEFQNNWETYQIGSSITRIIKNIEQLNQETIDQLFKLWGINTIASMQSEQNIKLYLYFQILKGDIICMELTIMKQVQTMGLIVKTENQQLAGFVAKYVQDFMKINQII